MDWRLVVRAMNAHPNPPRVATSKSQLTQTTLQFENPETDGRIPDERKAECIALMRDLIEAVAGLPKTKVGGSHD